MHVLLINLLSQKPEKVRSNKYWDVNPNQRFFPIGLAKIGTYLEKHGHSAEIFDMNLVSNPFSELRKRLEKKDYDVVGISLRNLYIRGVPADAQLEVFDETIKIVKESGSKVIVGGASFTAFANELMERFDIDVGIVGEGGETFLDLLKNLSNPERVKGICYRKNGRVVFTEKREPMKNIDFIPDFELQGLPKDFSVYDGIGVETRRGCNFKCIYCMYSIIQGSCIRLRSPESVVGEFEILRNNFGISNVFLADCIFHPKSHIENICDSLIKSKVGMNWSTHFREDIISKRLVEKTVRAGCNEFTFSPDSGSDKMLKTLQKELTTKDILKAANVMKDFKGVNTLFNMLLNVPGETMGTLGETFALVDKIRKLGLSGYVKFSRIHIFPRTKIAEIALKNNGINKDTDLLEPTFHDPPPLNLFAKPMPFYTLHLFGLDL
ncbi:MAG: radical SAM protein [Candidatus Aenigmatarchaeota archaeon]